MTRHKFCLLFCAVLWLSMSGGALQARGASTAFSVSGSAVVTTATPAQYGVSTLTAVTWSIRGTSADESYGTISTTGVYLPPAVVPVHNVISILATSTVDATKYSATNVTISNPVPVIATVSATPGFHSTFLVTVSGSNFLASSILLYKGYGVATTYVNATNLQFTLSSPPPAGTLVNLAVVNPSPGKTVSGNYSFAVPPTVVVKVAGDALVTPLKSAQYGATVTGTADSAVTWKISGTSSSENYGTISASGLYTPPPTVPVHGQISIVATSLVDTTKSNALAVTLSNPVPAITSANLTAKANKTFLVDVLGSNFMPDGVVLYGGYGAPTTYVNSGHLQFPIANNPAPGTVAPIGVINPAPGRTQSASFNLIIPSMVAVRVDGESTAQPGMPSQYVATVTGTSNGAVTWSVTAAEGASAGTISSTGASTGVYTPPASASASLAVTLTATSLAQPSVSASTVVRITGVSLAAAGRLLDQSTFGPTDSLIAHVQSVGLSNFIEEQIAMPPSLLPLQSQFPAACASNPYICVDEYWWSNAVTGPDQLRQRVSMALTEMLVVSFEEANTAMVGEYSNIMTRDAFANWSTIMKDMTLSTAMGRYLNMANSGKPTSGAIANENFARENMQLFNLGLYLLNQDGTLQTDSVGNPIPTFNEAHVEAFARVFTGWSYDTGTSVKPAFPTWSGNLYIPMVATESAHDTSAKKLLNTTLPAGQSAEQDLDGAIEDLFHHPNVGPFVTRQLIQHMVKSNPSPAYVGRIAAVFANDGKGVRGNMAAVVKAMLLDPQARAGDTNEGADDGYLREPILWTAGILRALNAVPKPLYNDYTAYTAIDTFANSQGQRVFNSPTVFNFYPAEWKLMNTGLNGPQFALETTATIMQKLTLSSNVVNNELGRLTIDLSAAGPLGKLAVAGNDLLLQELNNLFLHGRMPSQMRSTIMSAISGVTDPAQRVRTAVYLVISSPQYRVIH